MASILDDLEADRPPSILDGINTPKPSSPVRRVADMGIAAARGIIGVPEAAVGLADMVTGGHVGKALEGDTAGSSIGFRPKQAKEYLNTMLSPEQQAANRAVGEAKGFVPTLAAAVQNPSFISQQLVENVPTMLGGGALARGARALAPGMGPVVAGAVGEGILTAGQNVEQVRQEEPTGLITGQQAALNAAGGAITGGISLAGGKLAQKLGIADVQTMLAGGGKITTPAGKPAPGAAKRIIGGVLSEGLLQEAPQSYQEQVFQNLSQGKPWDEGAAESAAQGAIVGGIMGGGANVMPAKPMAMPAAPPAEVPAAPPEGIDSEFERAYGTPPGGLTDEQISSIRQEEAEKALTGTPQEPAPFDPDSHYEGFPPPGPDTNAPISVRPDPLHKPDAGPLSRAAAIAVDSGLAPDPYQAQPVEAHPVRAEVTEAPDLQMQNRDRSRPGSIAQMNAIANNPDYDRLGVGKSPNEAAPMVSVGANAPTIPETDFGKTSRVVMGDGSKIGVRYAVVEADSVLASHNADGSVNGDYFARVPPGTIRALNNGRSAALQAAWQRGTAEQYKQAMIEDAASHGIAPEAIEAKKAPVLVRVYDDIENQRSNIGALSNPQSHLKPSAPEQAQNDARFLDVSALHVDDAGSIVNAKNEGTFKQFLGSIPQAEQNELVSKTGYTKQFGDRIKAAVFAKAYGSADIVNQAVEDTDPDMKNVLHAMTAAAPEFAQVEHGGPLDIRPNIIEAVSLLREAKARKIPAADYLEHPDLLGRDPLTQTVAGFILSNARSAQRMAAAFSEAARFLQTEKAASTSGDMFGRPAATPADLAARVNAHLEKSYGEETRLKIAAEPSPSYKAEGEKRPASVGSGAPAAPDGDGGKPDKKQGTPAGAARAETRVVKEDAFEYEPGEGLSTEERAVESRFGANLAANTKNLRQRYAALEDSEGGKVLSVDVARELSDDYLKDRTISSAVQEPGSALIKRLYKEMLAEKPGPGEVPLVLFTAGGMGAGKTTGIADSPILRAVKGKAQIVLDSNVANFASAVKKIEQAKKAGKSVHIIYTYRELVDAFKFGAMKRAESQRLKFKTGRTVALNVFQETHVNSLATIKQLAEHYANDPMVELSYLDNSFGKGKAQLTTLEKLPEKYDNGIERKLYETLQNAREAGTISEETFAGFQPQKSHAGKFLSGNGEGRSEQPERENAVREEPARVREVKPFALTREADLSPVQLDLFNAAEAFVQKALTKLVDPARDTPKGRTAREQAIRDLTQAGRINVLAASINVDMLTEGRATLLGRQVTSTADLAVVAQVYRDPRYETLRYVIVKDGVVVHETAVSSRLPAATAVHHGEWADFMNGLRRTMETLKADGFYMLHNHPTGNAEPSEADLLLTRRIFGIFPKKFLGHTVIDTDEFTWISPGGAYETVKRDLGGKTPHSTITPSIGGQVAKQFLGADVRRTGDLAMLGKRLQEKGYVPLMGIGADGTLKALAELSLDQVKNNMRTRAMLLRFSRASGSSRVFLANVPNSHVGVAASLVKDGFLNDAVDTVGNSTLYSLQQRNVPVRPDNQGGRDSTRGLRVNEPQAPYTPQFKAWFGDSKVVGKDGKPLPVYHGTTKSFDRFVKKHLGTATGHPSSKAGFFFSANTDVADLFTEGRNGERAGANIVPAFLSIKNPLQMGMRFFQANYVAGGNKFDLVAKNAKENGHDGIHLLDNWDKGDRRAEGTEYVGDTWIAFDAKQIKSATGNSGAFDPKKASIVESGRSPYNTEDLFGNASAVKVAVKKKIRTVAPELADLPATQLDIFGQPSTIAGKEKPNGPNQNREAGAGGQEPGAVPADGKPGDAAGVLPGAGGRDTGSGIGNGQRQPGRKEGVQPGEQVDAAPESGDRQLAPAGRDGDRPEYLPGVPAGRDIPAKTGRNFDFRTDDLNYVGGWLTKGRQNVEALKLLKTLTAEGRQATREEQTVLAKYVGWGASELANKLFGDTLESAADEQRYFETALEELDGKGGRFAPKDVLTKHEPGYYPGYQLLSAHSKSFQYGSPVTRKQLMAAKPDTSTKGWIELRDAVKELLTPEQFAEASKSTQYAHYTSKEIVKGMWSAVRRMGFHGGAILEPGSGIGVFPGLMGPELANNTSYTGIEFEPVAGGILKQLFPDERIILGDFIKEPLPKDFYDMAIGNPPFASFPVLADPEYKKHGFLLHDYFFAKSIDRVKPGGLLVFVTSHGTLDKKNDSARKYLAERADLVGAIRLPQTAFKKNAGTEVVTDVLFLRKKVPGQTFEQGQDWLGVKGALDENGKPLVRTSEKGREQIFINEYFHAHPEMVLGTHSTEGSMRSASEYTVKPREGDIEQHFLTATGNLPQDIYHAGLGTSADAARVQQLDLDPKAKKEGGFYLNDKGVLMRVSSGVGLPAGTQDPVLKSYVPLRDALKQAQYDQLNNGPWEESLAALQKEYKRFVRAHGNIRANKAYERTTTSQDEVTGEDLEVTNKYRRWTHQKTLLQDPDYWLVAALENIDEESDVITASKALTERVLEKPSDPVISTPADALLATLNESGKVNVKRIAELAGVTEEEAIAGLHGSIYRAPSGEWQTADEYLSGDVRNKLQEALAAAASDKTFAANVEALRTVQPREIPHTDIDVSLGMNWLAPEVYEQFAREKLGSTIKATFVKVTGRWVIDARSMGSSDFDGGGRPAAWILQHAMTGAPIRVERTVPNGSGGEKQELNPDATAAANQKRTEMQIAFRQWLWEDPERTKKLTEEYNNTFNTVVPRQFNGQHLTLPGTSKLFNIFDHVKRGAWRIIQSGNTYLAHAVGSGKTFQMVIAAMEQKRLGLIKKPMMVVPRHMLAQFAAEWQALYPTARLMVADEKSFHTDVRREFVAKAALSDLDGIIITHSAFKLLDLDGDFKKNLIEEELNEFRAALVEAGGDLNPKTNKAGKPIRSRDPKVKQIEQAIEKMEQKLEALASSAGKDVKSARFDEMGVDQLYVDEAHEYRRLGFTTQRQMKGIQPTGSDQAFDMWMKTRWLEEKNPGRSLVMASGTPVTNTVAELYTVMRMMDPAALAAKGIARFDEWATMFGREDTQLEPDAAGEYTQVTRFTRFANLPELAQLFRKFADVLNSDDLGKLLGDKRPTVDGGARKIVIAPMTPALRSYREELKSRMKASKEWKPTFDEPNNPDPVIRIIGDGRLAAIDMRFVDPTLPSDPKSKLNVMLDGIVAVYKKANQPGLPVERGTQLVFSDYGLGEGVTASRGFNARAAMQRHLREAGIPPAEVAFIGDYNTAQKRLSLFRQMNEGKVRILVGGSRNLGTGTNVQKRLRAIHHLDTPWFPAHVEQREGRIIRAGNMHREVEVYGYATKGSYDETMWKLVATKQRFIDQAMSGDPNLRVIEDVSEVSNFEMASAMLADDERVLQLAGLRSEVEQLHRLYNSHQDDVGRAQRDVAMAKHQIERIESRDLPEAEKNAKKVVDLSGKNFTAKVGETSYNQRKEFGEAVQERHKSLTAKITEDMVQIGEISSFPIMFTGKILKSPTDKVVGYGSGVWMRVGDEKFPLADDPNSDPVGLAMRAGNIVAEVGKLPANMRSHLAEQKARVHALTPKLGAKFPMLAELLDKQEQQAKLEADIEENPFVDPLDMVDAEEADLGEAPRWLSDGGRPLAAEAPQAPYTPSPAGGVPPTAAPWVKRMDPATQEFLRKAGVWKKPQSIKERFNEFRKDMGTKILQGAVDQFVPVLRNLGEYPYKLLRMASSYDGGVEAMLFNGQLKVNTAGALDIKRGTAGLLEVLKPLQGETDRFLAWVAANRAERLSAVDREHLFTLDDIKAGKKLNTEIHPGDSLPNGQPGKSRAMTYAKVLRDFNEFSKSILDVAEASGLIDGPGRANWEHAFYVPFFREQEDNPDVGNGNVSGMVNQYAFKKLKGGTDILQDLLANTLNNWSHLLQASLKNNAAWQTLEHAETAGIAHRVREPQKGSVFVLKDGQKQHYVVDDPLVFDAIAALESAPFKGPVMKALTAFKHVLSAGVTLSPTYRVRNVIRDQISALAVNPTSYNFINNTLKGFQYSSRNNPDYGSMLAGGGLFRMGLTYQDAGGAHTKSLLNKAVEGATVLDTPAKAKEAMGWAWDWWKETGNRAESITRANLYKQTKKKMLAAGKSEDEAHFEASYVARDALDFGLHGTWPALRMITQVVPFMNARLQGLYKLKRGAEADPRRFAAVIGGVTLATIALTLAYRDDDDYKRLSEYQRDNYWWFKIGGKAFLIPKPFEIGALATIIDRGLEAAMNGLTKEDQVRFGNSLASLVGSQLNMNPIPQAVFPAIQLWANKNAFTGNSIESEYNQGLSKENRIGANTSATAQLLGKANILSPQQIDFLVNAYLGWAGSHAVATADLALRPLMALPEKAAPKTDDYFVIGDFVKDMPSDQSRFVERFYTHLQDVQQAMGDLRNFQKTGQLEKASELLASGDVDFKVARLYTSTAREMGDIGRRIRYINMSNMDPDAKREEITRLTNLRNVMAERVEKARATVEAAAQ